MDEGPTSAPASDGAGGAPTFRLRSVPWVAVEVFAVVSFGLSWLVAIPLWRIGAEDPAFPVLLGLVASVMMTTPAIGAVVALFVARIPRGERLRLLGMWPLRPARRVVWWTVCATVAPLLVVALAIGIAALFGWTRLDLVGFSGFRATIDAQLGALDGSTAELARATMPPIGALVALQIAAVPLGALVNSVLAFGEELGWRGWLLPALRPLGTWPALLVSGAVWGLWHSPLILLGYNFGLTDWRGVALMTAGCVAWGVLLGWARLRTGSVWPAVVGHGALNASGGLIVVVAAAGAPLDPALVLPLGASGWIAIAAVVVILVLCGQFRVDRQRELAPRRVPARP
ncbi:CPBP family intramembrane metalloprotease [Leucobacter allii]|uniref:CPBP family intramembrane metalloprotease n=1 Tax=Leucobacter allii TaxID=2932247 RepID=A0ABY4FJP8_9MICO|nr:CPBP family intramembrane glutamic endopeptidase [Leucobacter allii]UOQ56247.1 CPBP family intramembrane metalloprotease [Leucobacter allii]